MHNVSRESASLPVIDWDPTTVSVSEVMIWATKTETRGYVIFLLWL